MKDENYNWMNEDEAVTGMKTCLVCQNLTDNTNQVCSDCQSEVDLEEALEDLEDGDLPNHGLILDPDAEEVEFDENDLDGEVASEEYLEYLELCRSLR